ncbi:MAG: indolepyruvate ferredoxin oxidoreductase [Deltaproteobacteria bacterium]|nr:indolepyruvate ferredoxin oxidoreductase [Deltaproteobacteria bacterium]
MEESNIKYDPYNLIITGVGGQGNVMASRVLGNMLSKIGYTVTIGETFGASQRGGSVMSHLRISSSECYSPQIAKGRAHMIIALEPTEAIRVLAQYGNEDAKVLCNTRPIHSVGVISGEQAYPSQDEIQGWINDLTSRAWFINATDEAMTQMKNPIFGNIMLLGALAATNELPLNRDDFEAVISETMTAANIQLNLTAYDKGSAMLN